MKILDPLNFGFVDKINYRLMCSSRTTLRSCYASSDFWQPIQFAVWAWILKSFMKLRGIMYLFTVNGSVLFKPERLKFAAQ